MRRSAFALIVTLTAPALAGPVTTPWTVAGPDDTAAVAAAPLAGRYAAADSFEDTVEVRDINQNVIRTVTRAQIVALMPGATLDGSQDGPNSLAFSDSGRLLFIGVHEADPPPFGGEAPNDAVLRLDVETGQLTRFAFAFFSATDAPWPHPSLVHFRGRLYVGEFGAVQVYRAQANDLVGTYLFTAPAPLGQVVNGLTIDRLQNHIYIATSGRVYRSTIGASSLAFNLVGQVANLRALAWTDHYGGPSNAGLYALESTTAPEFYRVWHITPAQARGQQAFAPAAVLSGADDWHDLCATADGALLAGADEDAVRITDTLDTRLSYQQWLNDEFTQTVNFAKGLISPDGEPAGWVIDADVTPGGTRFHPATPDAAAWAILLLLMDDELNADPAAQGLVRDILTRYAGLAPDGIAPSRTADGIFRHWIDPATGGAKGAWNPEFATLSTMKICIAAARARAYYPGDAAIQSAAREITCGVTNWDAYVKPSNDAMYFKGLAGGGPDLTSETRAFHEGMLFMSLAAAYGGSVPQTSYGHWLERGRWPIAQYVSGQSVTGSTINVFLPAFVSHYEQLLLADFRNDAAWQQHMRALRISHAGWTDDNAPRWNTVFSAGTTKSEWDAGGYNADSLSDHPGDVATFTSLMAFGATPGAGGGGAVEAVAAYNAYRRGARQTFDSGASILYRRSSVDPGYNPNSAGLPDVALGALGLADLIAPGSVAAVLTGAYPSCAPCGSPDFDGDGDTGTDADVEAFLACLGGNCCPTCGNPDFDADGDTGTDADIETFFRVLGGGTC